MTPDPETQLAAAVLAEPLGRLVDVIIAVAERVADCPDTGELDSLEVSDSLFDAVYELRRQLGVDVQQFRLTPEAFTGQEG